MEPGALLDLDTVVQDAWEMEPLPASVSRLAGIVADENSDLADLVEVVTFDQTLTAKLLRAANSSSSASLSPVATVAAAIQRLGSGAVLSFAMATTVHGKMKQAIPEYGLVEGQLWRHSVCSAVVAQLASRALKTNVPGETFTSALLHDIGKLLLARFLDPELLQHLRRAQSEGQVTMIRAETEILGVNHAELGGIMAQRWGLPDSIVRAVHFHHDPDGHFDGDTHHPAYQRICDLTHVCDVVAHCVEEKGEEVRWDEHIQTGAWERLALTVDKVEALAKQVETDLELILLRYGR